MATISDHRPGIQRAGDAPLVVAAGTIVVGAAATTLFAPDMVTGSTHDHFPLAGLLA